MKHCYWLISVILFACSDKPTDNQTGISKLELTKQDLSIIQCLKTRAAARNAREDVYNIFARFESYNIIPFLIYQLDEDKFYSNPSPEKLMQSLYLPEDEKWYVGFGQDTVLFSACKDTEGEFPWYNRDVIYNWTLLYKWLPEALKNAGITNYTYFNFRSIPYITFIKNGKRVFYTYNGKDEYSADKFCEMVVSDINMAKQNGANSSRSTINIEERKQLLKKLGELLEKKAEDRNK